MKVLKILGIIFLVLALIVGVVVWKGYKYVKETGVIDAAQEMSVIGEELKNTSPEVRQQVKQCINDSKHDPEIQKEMDQAMLEQCAGSKDEKCEIQAALKVASKMARDCVNRYKK